MTILRAALLLLSPLLFVRPAAAAAADRSLSPYFFVEGGEPGTDALPLKSTEVRFAVNGVIAEVAVTQRYENRGARPLHARYVFPGSTHAAVHGLRMKIGERVIEAEIRERKQAEQLFEAAKREGKSASLLEQERPNVFTMNVANILPGDRIEVELRYTELLVPTSGVYELVYPTVVGPRYAGSGTEASPFLASPYLHAGKAPSSTFSIAGSITAGLPVHDLASPSHAIQATSLGSDTTAVALDAKEGHGGNRDFILRYRLSGDEIATGLSLYERGGERYFLLLMQPPRRPRIETVPPREYVFVVDVSGSMRGFPLDVTKRLMNDLIGSLRPTDRFNVLLFSGDSALMAERSIPATAANLDKARAFVDAQQGGGGTELQAALERAMAIPQERDDARSFVVITDGYIAAERGLFDSIRRHVGQASVFAFGIGTSVNRSLIEGIARAGLGEPFVVTKPEEAAETARRFASYMRTPLLANVQVRFEGFDAYEVGPRVLPTLFAERPLVLTGKWRGPARGGIVVSGTRGGRPAQRFEQRIDVSTVHPSADRGALAALWARSRVDELSELPGVEISELARQEITEIGLSHHMLTQFTSFLAVDKTPRDLPAQSARQVAQPQPMPAGVEDSAIGEGPEPSVLLLSVMAALLAFFTLRRRQVSA